jgi:hypothetical protein
MGKRHTAFRHRVLGLPSLMSCGRARMMPIIILEALSGHGATAQRTDRCDRQLGNSSRDGGAYTPDDQRLLNWLEGRPRLSRKDDR